MALQVYNGSLSPFSAATDSISGDHYSYIKLVDATVGSTNLAKVDAQGRLAGKIVLSDTTGANLAVIDAQGRVAVKNILSDSTGANIAVVDVNGRQSVKGILTDLTGANTLSVDASSRLQAKSIIADGAGTNLVVVDSQGFLHTRIAPITETFLAPAAVGNKVISIAQVVVNLSTHMTGAAASATHAFIRVPPTSQAGIKWWVDGDSPTQTNGMDLGIGEAEEFSSISNMKMISNSASLAATITVQYKRYNSTTF